MISYGGAVGDSTILQSTDRGQSWSDVSSSGLPSSLLTGISCPTSDDCWAAGSTAQPGPNSPAPSQGVLAVSTDQGQTWQQATLPANVGTVAGVSCPSTNACYALAFLQSNSGSISFGLLSNVSS
jgi:photosystem II stability/assembly factor-like uncharacterized protein